MNHNEDWEKRKKELLDEYHTMQEMKEEKQKKKDEASTTDMKRPFVLLLFLLIAIFIICIVFQKFEAKKELERVRDTPPPVKENTQEAETEENTEEDTTKTMECESKEIIENNYYTSFLSISVFRENRLVTYEYIDTNRYVDQQSYESAKQSINQVNDVIFDNNRWMIKTYFGNGHSAHVPEEDTYLGKSIEDIKKLEESRGATCTIAS